MNRKEMFAIALAATACASAFAQTPKADDPVAELRAKVQELQTQVDQLKSQNDQNWLTEKRADEIKGLVQDVLADADSRASLLQGGMTSGWDNGFFIMSPDGNFKLIIGGQLQVRFNYSRQHHSPVDDNRSGFEMRRAKLVVKGNVVDPSWTYEADLAADRSTGNVMLEDNGWIQKNLGNGWIIRAGQTKAPFTREEMISGARQLTVDRSLMNSQFTAGTVQGLLAGWEGDQLHIYGMFHDGNKSANTPWSAEDTEYALSGRAEWLAMGAWKTMQDYDSFRDEGQGLVLGGGVNWSRSEFGTGHNLPAPDFNNAEVDNLGLTADVTWDLGGASIAGAVVYRRLEVDATSTTMDQIGFMVRGGLFLTDDWELYGQYEWGDLDTPGVEDLSVVTVGATKFWAKHTLKWQTDIGYAFNQIASTWASDTAGWRADASGEDGQIVVRSQIQLLF